MRGVRPRAAGPFSDARKGTKSAFKGQCPLKNPTPPGRALMLKADLHPISPPDVRMPFQKSESIEHRRESVLLLVLVEWAGPVWPKKQVGAGACAFLGSSRACGPKRGMRRDDPAGCPTG
ncbi:hypothetical protein D7Y41_25160 [Anaerotruncus sp. 1XD22-93]|nr:hypothetical protein D7Y41_25160 [Anaerotruncus sp. 1XD22-93]